MSSINKEPNSNTTDLDSSSERSGIFIWEGILEALVDDTDFEWLMIDASHVKVHPDAAGAGMTGVMPSSTALRMTTSVS